MSPKWKIERSFFDKEVMGYDPKTKKDQTWPYYSAEEDSWKDTLSKTQDPKSKAFHKKRDTEVEYDDEGNPKEETRKIVEKEPHFERTQIIRLRTKEGKEFLYSRGKVYLYTQLGSLITHSFQEPEKWEQWEFKHENKFIPQENVYKEVCQGPIHSITHYTIPFTKENVDKLMENAITNVSLIVKQEGRPDAKQCRDLEMFKTKPFDYILNDEWQSAADRERAKIEFEATQNNIIAKRKQQQPA